MQINLVNVGDSLIALGFRKMASFSKSIHPNSKFYHVSLQKGQSVFYKFRELFEQPRTDDVSEDALREIGKTLAQADMVGFSSMTAYAPLTKRIIQAVRNANPDAFIVWGGIHPIVHPEDAILSSDAICTGEGEYAFKNFLELYKDKNKDYTGVGNFWFNRNGEIIRNDFLPLNTHEDMEKFPFPLYGDDENEYLFKPGKGFVPLTSMDYIEHNGLAYNTVWSIGCPYECTYCSNSVFIENDKNYRKLRHPSVDYIIGEVKSVLRTFPHISNVVFSDDSFMALPKVVLQEFSSKWRREVQLPFYVAGIIPSFVREEKMEILVRGGMNQVRMGIQSGSDRILEFYKRPNKPGLIKHAASIIGKFSNYMLLPTYDIIVDNPIETRQDILDTLNLLYDLPRPFTLNIFSLRVIPNSVMEQQFLDRKLTAEEISSTYFSFAPTVANALVFLLAVFKLPRFLFDFLLKYAHACREKQVETPFLLLCCRCLYLVKRGLSHLTAMDFSRIPGGWTWWLWKLGIIRWWRTQFARTYPELRLQENSSKAGE